MVVAIENYNTTFGSSGIAFNCTNQLSQNEAIKPSSLLLSKQPKKRLRRYNEQYNTDNPSQPARKIVRSVQQCSFCSKSGHQVTNCPKIAEYKHKSSMVSTNSERLNLINNFRSTTRIYASLPTPSQIVTTLEKNLYNAAFIIHSIRAKYPSADYGEMNMEDMNIKVSFITDGGEVQGNDKRLVIDGTIVEILIHTAN